MRSLIAHLNANACIESKADHEELRNSWIQPLDRRRIRQSVLLGFQLSITLLLVASVLPISAWSSDVQDAGIITSSTTSCMSDINGLRVGPLSNSDILFICGKRYFENKEYARARPYFERIVNDYPNDKNFPAGSEYLAQCNRLQGRAEETKALEVRKEMPQGPWGESMNGIQLSLSRMSDDLFEIVVRGVDKWAGVVDLGAQQRRDPMPKALSFVLADMNGKLQKLLSVGDVVNSGIPRSNIVRLDSAKYYGLTVDWRLYQPLIEAGVLGGRIIPGHYNLMVQIEGSGGSVLVGGGSPIPSWKGLAYSGSIPFEVKENSKTGPGAK